MTQIYSYLHPNKWLLSCIPSRSRRMVMRIWRVTVRSWKLLISPSNKDCESVHRYLKVGNSKSPSWLITQLRFITLGLIFGAPRLLWSNRLHREIIQIRFVQVSNLLVSWLDNIILYTSSFYIGRMIWEGVTDCEKQTIKILEDVASNPSIADQTNQPLILFLSVLIFIGIVSILFRIESIQIINNQVVPNDIVSRESLNIPGPMTELDMIKVDDFLRNQALIDNLMISPIGELWPDQW